MLRGRERGEGAGDVTPSVLFKGRWYAVGIMRPAHNANSWLRSRGCSPPRTFDLAFLPPPPSAPTPFPFHAADCVLSSLHVHPVTRGLRLLTSRIRGYRSSDAGTEGEGVPALSVLSIREWRRKLPKSLVSTPRLPRAMLISTAGGDRKFLEIFGDR